MLKTLLVLVFVVFISLILMGFHYLLIGKIIAGGCMLVLGFCTFLGGCVLLDIVVINKPRGEVTDVNG